MIVRPIFQSILLFFILLLAGCVGTVQEAVPPDSTKIVNPPVVFAFPGIVSSRAVSHNKVELEFFPAGGGSQISYKLYVNNSTTPVPIDPKSLLPASGGRVLYTVDNLNDDQEYKFKITAYNTKTGAISKNENEAFARTFDNIVANFLGVSKVSLVPGNTYGAILVDWVTPTMTGVFTAGPFDPVHYEVSMISDIGGIGNLNNPFYFGTDKKTIYVPTPPARATPLSHPNSVIVDGLVSNTRYYVQVRAINTLYQDKVEDPTVTTISVSREVNTRFLSIKTDNAGSLFDFRQDNVVLANASGVDAFDKIDVFWQPGTGSFSSYRIFVRKYDGSGDPNTDDKLTETVMNSMTSIGNYQSVSAALTTKRVGGLDNYSHYQVKVVLCKTITCPVLSADPNAGIISDLNAIRVQPTLASFSGINTVEPPGQYNEKDVVKLRFDAPLINSGFANVLEFYCVNPLDHSQQILFDGTNTISGSGIPNCDGLYLNGTVPPLGSFTTQKVKGLITDGTKEYCFASTPAITGFGADIRLPVSSRIVRCSYPEVFPPSVAQFPGFKNQCVVSATNGFVEWSLPTGGIYSGFNVFWKEKSSSQKFSFPDAIDGDPGYFASEDLSAATLNYTATNLMPGRTYQIGVLAKVDFDPPATDLFSEYNLRVYECVVPLPVATFKGFNRIFAIGPKIDGRVPNDASTKTFAASSQIFEAINADGIPYEVAMDTAIAPNISANFAPPPGRDFGASFAAGFDGASDPTTGYALSKDGIISLAWEDVTMSFPEADTIFSVNQPAPPVARTPRSWGYKVFRSDDNKLTWKELTTTNGPIYSSTYSYYKKPNVTATSTRTAFFTDYSVKALQETYDASSGLEIDRARNYYYMIVPVFDGKVLSYSSGNHHVVKVALPPRNMALVHRWMSNRSRCHELDKDPIIGSNYSCAYNGIGARPKSYPYRTGDTALDQGGDILIDRQELGCRYTRGDKIADPAIGASIFELSPGERRHPNDANFFPLFKGYRTFSNLEDTSTPFKGCAGRFSNNRETSTAADYPPSFVADYQHYLQGDCMGSHREVMSVSPCSAAQYSLSEFTTVALNTPGMDSSKILVPDCSADTPFEPTSVTTRYTGYYAPNYVMQSEFMAVFYNTRSSSLTSSERNVPVEGPTTGFLTGSRKLENNWAESNASSQCSINLAAIDSNDYMKPRWITVNELGGKRIRFKNSNQGLLEKTVNEITEVVAATVEPLSFYNGTQGDPTVASWKLPSASLRNSPRYRGETKLGKIISSNAAKLPPLGRLNNEVAESLCSNFLVQTGAASDNGNFSPDSPPMGKRTLRRIESIAASAWPESYNTTKITAMETSISAGSCATPAKNLSGFELSKGDLINNRSAYGNNVTTNTPLITGSSRYNGLAANSELYHTEQCISRYGIQDMVGNVSEGNSERIFCDYSQDQAYLGPVSASHGGGLAAENQGDGSSVFTPFFNSNDQRYRWGVLKSGSPLVGTDTQFEIRFRNGDAAVTNAKPWVKISTDSGYCSVVDDIPSRRTGATDFFKDISTGYWNPMYVPGGALNITMITRTQTDQESVMSWRNGDGRYLDFGPQGIGAAFNRANTLALHTGGITASDAAAQSKYFNPVIGLPLLCEADSCEDPAIISSGTNDNTSITTAFLKDNLLGTDDDPPVKDFHVGNSQITHLGLSDYQYDVAGFSSTTVPTNGATNISSVDTVLTAMVVDDPTTMGNPTYVSKNYPEDFTRGSDFQYYKVIWAVERGSEFGISSGGKSNERYSGRYTASINRTSVTTSILHTGTNDFTGGSRCAVMINQEP